MTSGSSGIDYFVSSDLFETTASTDAREARRIAGTASDIVNPAEVDNGNGTLVSSGAPAVDTVQTTSDGLSHRGGVLTENRRRKHDHDPPWRGRGDGTQDYTEQLVLFDSLTASLPEMFGPPNAPKVAALSTQALLSGLVEEGDHAYHCIQHSKKFHPNFDPVLRGVLLGDSAAKILLTAGSKVCCYKGRFVKKTFIYFDIESLPPRSFSWRSLRANKFLQNFVKARAVSKHGKHATVCRHLNYLDYFSFARAL